MSRKSIVGQIIRLYGLDSEEVKPIKDYDITLGLGDIAYSVPLCPHCKEVSYYTDSEAKKNDGFTMCPFCEGLMYMEDFFEGKKNNEV